jgi:peroxiredoxin
MAALYVAVFLLYRYLGINALNSEEGRVRQGPTTMKKPKEIALNSVDGAKVILGSSSDRPRVVLFAALGCAACTRSRVYFNMVRAERFRSCETVVVYGGADERTAREFAAAFKYPVTLIADKKSNAMAKWKIYATPFVIKFDSQGVVTKKGVVRSDRTIESLYVVDGKNTGDLEASPRNVRQYVREEEVTVGRDHI